MALDGRVLLRRRTCRWSSARRCRRRSRRAPWWCCLWFRAWCRGRRPSRRRGRPRQRRPEQRLRPSRWGFRQTGCLGVPTWPRRVATKTGGVGVPTAAATAAAAAAPTAATTAASTSTPSSPPSVSAGNGGNGGRGGAAPDGGDGSTGDAGGDAAVNAFPVVRRDSRAAPAPCPGCDCLPSLLFSERPHVLRRLRGPLTRLHATDSSTALVDPLHSSRGPPLYYHQRRGRRGASTTRPTAGEGRAPTTTARRSRPGSSWPSSCMCCTRQVASRDSWRIPGRVPPR